MSRYTTGLVAIDEVACLLKYLYLSEEYSVEFENSIGIRFSLKMNDDMELHRIMLNGVSPGMDFPCPDMTHTHLMAVVDQLKEAPAVEYPEEFGSRWDEVKSITALQIGHNEYFQTNGFKNPSDKSKSARKNQDERLL